MIALVGYLNFLAQRDAKMMNYYNSTIQQTRWCTNNLVSIKPSHKAIFNSFKTKHVRWWMVGNYVAWVLKETKLTNSHSLKLLTVYELALPTDFPHDAPPGYRYRTADFKSNVISIWCDHLNHYNYNSGASVSTIWGFYNTKKRCYFSPINHKRPGKVVDVSTTTAYTAMPLLDNGPSDVM